jgi:hypothetical protein
MTVLYYILSFLAGAVLAAVFTGGLWITVQKMTVSNRPYLLAVGSFYFAHCFCHERPLPALAGRMAAYVCRPDRVCSSQNNYCRQIIGI